jgi:hypothetical protein
MVPQRYRAGWTFGYFAAPVTSEPSYLNSTGFGRYLPQTRYEFGPSAVLPGIHRVVDAR